jgi:hypothetical protein
MKEKIESISILNVVCFILYGLSDILNNPTLFNIGFIGVIISFLFSIWLLCKSLHFREEEKQVFTRSVNSIIFCIFFFVCYFLTK